MTAILLNLESCDRASDGFICKFRLSAGGPEEVEPIAPLVESEPLGLLWSVSEI